MPRFEDDEDDFPGETGDDNEYESEFLTDDELMELEFYMGDFDELDYLDELEQLDDDEDFYTEA